jgi:acyl-CoA synthetase (NDP forming)
LFKKIDTVLRAKSVALVGASERARWPKVIYNNLKENGFAGNVYPVNPNYDEVWGTKCYRGIAQLPEKVDHAVVIVPARAVLDVVAEGLKAGIKSTTVYAANMGDGPYPESHARGKKLLQMCNDAGVVVAGPNCMGAMSWREKLFLYPNPNMPKFGPGPVGVVFQSGGSLQMFVESCGARGLRFSYAVSSGNELGVDLSDYINFMVDDPHTRVIALFVEGLRKVEAFKEAAARALAAKKPIVCIKTGRSIKSREAAQSHTGAIGGDWNAFAAVCERYGVVICPSLDDMTETLLAFQQPRLPKGRNIGFVTTSGGSVDLLYDYGDDTGAVFPEFSAKTKKLIRPHIAEEITIKNPLDCGIPQTVEVQANFCRAILSEPSIDMVAFAARPGRMTVEEAEPLRKLAAETEKPLIAFERMRYPVSADALKVQAHLGIPFLQGLPETVRALNAMAFFGARAGKKIKLPAAPKGKAANLAGPAFDKLLGRKGVTLPKSALVKTGKEAAKAAAKIGFPVVLKIVAPAFSHKTEVGGVLLGLKSAAAVEEGAKTLEGRIRAVDKKAKITGYLVQEMVSGVEMIVGCRQDPIYGPIIILGAGGIMVELLKDVAMRLLPVTADDVRAMLSEVKSAKLLEGFRGSKPADVEALVKAVVGLGDIFLEHRHLLDDLEVNPLIVRPRGKGVAAVDVRPVKRSKK